MSVERFDIEKVTTIFQSSLHGKDDILMDEYLQAYEEINKFFHLMGSVFGFVSSDIRNKIDLLSALRKKEDVNEEFSTVKRMIQYEVRSGLFQDSKYVSGSRTLLRLHRGLEFVYEFLFRLAELSETDKTNKCCKDAYLATLSKHHPWVIRKGALMAMYALPTQGELLKRVCVNVQNAIEMLPEMLKHTSIVYERTDQLYELFNLHGLP